MTEKCPYCFEEINDQYISECIEPELTKTYPGEIDIEIECPSCEKRIRLTTSFDINLKQIESEMDKKVCRICHKTFPIRLGSYQYGGDWFCNRCERKMELRSLIDSGYRRMNDLIEKYKNDIDNAKKELAELEKGSD